jgi:hypothetical protein
MQLFYTHVFATEDTDTNNIVNNKIFIIGIQKIDSLIELEFTENNIWLITEKRNLEYFSNINYSKNPFSVLDSNTYNIIPTFPSPSFVWKYLLYDNISLELRDILLKSYPYRHVISPMKLFKNREEHIYKHIRYGELQCNYFLVLLVHVPLYNEYQSHIQYDPDDDKKYLFPDNPCVQGMYIKVLIPLLEEDDE